MKIAKIQENNSRALGEGRRVYYCAGWSLTGLSGGQFDKISRMTSSFSHIDSEVAARQDASLLDIREFDRLHGVPGGFSELDC